MDIDEKAFERVFKALSHPKRREIIRIIAKKGAVSYKELAKLEPKPGVLYHHLKLLKGLVYQDENKLYRLTNSGYKALELMETFFIEPKESFPHNILTPRGFLERLEGRNYYLLFLLLYALSYIVWFFDPRYTLIFLLVVPFEASVLVSSIIPVISWLASTLVLSIITRLVFQRFVNIPDLALKTLPTYLLLNILGLLMGSITNKLALEILYIVFEAYALLLIISAVSVVARISLRKSALVVIPLHYASLIIYLFLII
ncbi:MAG: winged helix-turn-helix domain-containing protein [Candidatus Njordarchaeales archaeon]